jgi:formylmethanofuran dehydrogenase subunit E
MNQKSLAQLLAESSARHSHLCPRQVLGVRIGLAGGAALGLELPRADKRLLVILETDGCFADGINVATGASVGHRTLRVEDYGKIAATFADTLNGRALRIAPRLDVRQRAWEYAPGETRRYFAQLQAYQLMPEAELLACQEVHLSPSLEAIVSRAGLRTNCSACGEEIINQRQVVQNGALLCRACAGQAYYQIPLDIGAFTIAAALA